MWTSTALQVQVQKKTPWDHDGEKKSNEGKTKVQRAVTVSTMATANFAYRTKH